MGEGTQSSPCWSEECYAEFSPERINRCVCARFNRTFFVFFCFSVLYMYLCTCKHTLLIMICVLCTHAISSQPHIQAMLEEKKVDWLRGKYLPELASFPGPVQLFVACSTEKRGLGTRLYQNINTDFEEGVSVCMCVHSICCVHCLAI